MISFSFVYCACCMLPLTYLLCRIPVRPNHQRPRRVQPQRLRYRNLPVTKLSRHPITPVVNYSQKTSPGGTSTGSTSGGALSQRSSKSSNRTGSSGSVGATGVGNDSREPTPPPIPPHPPSEVNDNQNNHVTTNMQPIPQVSR